MKNKKVFAALLAITAIAVAVHLYRKKDVKDKVEEAKEEAGTKAVDVRTPGIIADPVPADPIVIDIMEKAQDIIPAGTFDVYTENNM